MSRGTFINTLLLFSEHFSHQLHQSEVATMNKSRQEVFMNKLVLAFQKAYRQGLSTAKRTAGKEAAFKRRLPAQRGWGKSKVAEFSDKVLLSLLQQEEGDSSTSGITSSFPLPFFCFLMNCWLSPNYGFPFTSLLILASKNLCLIHKECRMLLKTASKYKNTALNSAGAP